MATTRKENEGAIEAFKQAQARLGLPVILTVNCAKRRDDALKIIDDRFDAELKRIKDDLFRLIQTSGGLVGFGCLQDAQDIADEKLEACKGRYGEPSKCTAADYEAIYLDLYQYEDICNETARRERQAAMLAFATERIPVIADYAMCCINNPGSCDNDTPSMEM